MKEELVWIQRFWSSRTIHLHPAVNITSESITRHHMFTSRQVCGATEGTRVTNLLISSW